MGRDFEVKLLSGSERDGVWGTSEYQVRVNSQGVMRYLKVRGRELLFQAAALYTSPCPPGDTKGIRTVQGEGVGDRGLGVKPPSVERGTNRGMRTFRFCHEIAKPAIFDGETLCNVQQTITLTPTGEISVVYDCEWTHTCRWVNFGILILYNTKEVADCEYMGLRGDRVFTGRLSLNASNPLEARLREPLEQLTVRSPEGPVHVLWDPLPSLTFSWSKSIQLWVRPSVVPYRGTIHKGTRGRIAYRILLPVSQE